MIKINSIKFNKIFFKILNAKTHKLTKNKYKLTFNKIQIKKIKMIRFKNKKKVIKKLKNLKINKKKV